MEVPTYSPREIVSELDRFIVGQNDAKRAVAIALRNRWRRLQLPDLADARGGDAEEHPDDRPDRLRQDRDRPAVSRKLARRAVPQGRGDQVHRGRLCRPRRRAASSAIWSRSAIGMLHQTSRKRKDIAGQGRTRGRGAAFSTALVGVSASASDTRSTLSAASFGTDELEDKEIEVERGAAARRQRHRPDVRICPTCPAPRSADDQSSPRCSARACSAAHEAQARKMRVERRRASRLIA